MKTIPEVLTCLADEITVLKASYREADGKIRNKEALHDIECLKLAIRTIKKSCTPKTTKKKSS